MSYLLAHLGAFATGGAAFSIISYAARTFPMPKNLYAAWLVSVLQYALANPDKAK